MKLFQKNDTLIGVLDHPKNDAEITDAIQIRGWVVSLVRQDVDIEVEVDGKKMNVRMNRSVRQNVRELYAKYADYNPNPGYRALLSAHSFQPGIHTLAVWARSRRERKLIGQVQFKIPERSSQDEAVNEIYSRNAGIIKNEPRILFVHIPKTAGTSLSDYLAAQFAPEATITHAENRILGKKPVEVGRLDSYRLVTAHLKLDTLTRFLDRRNFFTITVIRDPVKQLASHLSWVKRLADPKKRAEYDISPTYIQNAANRIATLDLAEFLNSMTLEERLLFDNCQIRYMLGQEAKTIGENEILPALLQLGNFDLVGTTDRLYEFLLMVSYYMGWAPPPRAPRLNTGNKDYAVDLVNVTDDSRAAIDGLTRLDKVLYEHVKTHFEAQFRAMLKSLSLEQTWEATEDLNPATVAERILYRSNIPQPE